MRWSWRLGKFVGVEFYVHWTFLLLVTWIAVSYVGEQTGPTAALQAAGFLVATVFCLALHELGHFFMARRLGMHTREITILPVGGVSRMDRMATSPHKGLAVALAGPAVSGVLCLFLLMLLWETRTDEVVSPVVDQTFITNLLWVNVILLGANLIPTFPMDGGRALRSLLVGVRGYWRATETVASLGQIVVIACCVLGMFVHPLMFVVALFVHLGAEAELRTVLMQTTLANVPVCEAMATDIRTLRPDDSLQIAAGQLLHGNQLDFPVVSNNQLVGILRRDDLMEGLRTGGRNAAVRDVMTSQPPTADPLEMLDNVIERFQAAQLSSLPVISQGRVIGMLTVQGVGELVMLRSAMADAEGISNISQAA